MVSFWSLNPFLAKPFADRGDMRELYFIPEGITNGAAENTRQCSFLWRTDVPSVGERGTVGYVPFLLFGFDASRAGLSDLSHGFLRLIAEFYEEPCCNRPGPSNSTKTVNDDSVSISYKATKALAGVCPQIFKAGVGNAHISDRQMMP